VPADDLDAFRTALRAELATRLAPPREQSAPSVLGAGSDNVDECRDYVQALAGTGAVAPTWPREYGGMDADATQARVVAEELAQFHRPDLYPLAVGLMLVGPVLLRHGNDEQKARYLPRIVSGEEAWCQLFSEPDAGSDLAGLASRADRDGDEWRISGSKVWSSRAHYSERGLLLARHDFAVPKHTGITAFLLDMDQPGVTVQPLRQMNGDTHFNQVFLDGARVSDRDRLDEVGKGWAVALTTLAFERGGLAAPSGSGLGDAGLERLIARARELGLANDPRVRQRLADLYVQTEIMGWTARRARAARVPGPEGSGMKLRATRLLKALADLALALEGPAGVAGSDWETLFLTAPSLSIRGGTDEVQRNIMGERVLGLPGDIRVDKDRPFGETLP
jgi:alkylation response protein AidB-like acyl-CoA dehydrogenase